MKERYECMRGKCEDTRLSASLISCGGAVQNLPLLGSWPRLKRTEKLFARISVDI